MANTKEGKKNNKFVSINRPKDVRVTNLESLKEAVKGTKTYYRIKILRQKKNELMKQLKDEAKELELLFGKLYELFPEHDLLEDKKPTLKSESSNIRNKASSKINRTKEDLTNSEIERLERALSMIEDKLKKL